jgi:hypothetical protein
MWIAPRPMPIFRCPSSPAAHSLYTVLSGTPSRSAASLTRMVRSSVVRHGMSAISTVETAAAPLTAAAGRVSQDIQTTFQLSSPEP